MEKPTQFVIEKYSPKFEEDWLGCLKEAFYNSKYHDTILKMKPRYETPAIELIARHEDKIIGFLDVEIVSSEEQLCEGEISSAGQVSLLTVHPRYRRKGVGRLLLKTACEELKRNYRIGKIECFFREDSIIVDFLTSLGFKQCDMYYELTFTRDFFDKYRINLPFGVNPSLLTGFVQEEEYRNLINNYPPENTIRILVFQTSI